MQEYSMFERLPLRSQAEVLAKDGTVLAQRRFNGWTVTLYALHSTFVERWSGKEAEVYSTFKKSADAVTVLEPYLDAIDVQDLLN